MPGPVNGDGTGGIPGVTGGGTGGSDGVVGLTDTGIGVSGLSTTTGVGVRGTSASKDGVQGTNGAGSGITPTLGCGVQGQSANGYGVFGASNGATGIQGVTASQTHYGVTGINNSAWPCAAIFGTSSNGHGVRGTNGTGSGKSPLAGAGVWGDSDQGYGVFGASKTGSAGVFDGNVAVTGNLSATGNVVVTGTVTAKDVLLSGMDCAEDFAIANAASLEAGTVVVFDGEDTISPCKDEYSKRAAGVISGAGKYQPGVVLGRNCASGVGKAPVALLGRVYCKVDADFSAIEVGDLLTTSSTPGHAMKASDPLKGIGSVIGKALRPMESGKGLLPILVALQ
jgi:hypothetical protein